MLRLGKKFIACSLAIAFIFAVLMMKQRLLNYSSSLWMKSGQRGNNYSGIVGEDTSGEKSLQHRVKLTVRMPANQLMVERFFCWLLRSAVLFWDSSYGKIIIILDDADRQRTAFFPGKLTSLNLPFVYEFIYERNPSKVSKFERLSKEGYNRGMGYYLQLYSFFIMDEYFRDDDVIAYIDNDAVFTMPVVNRSIMVNGKLVVKGFNMFNPVRRPGHITAWDEMTTLAIGLPMVADFMTFFPTYFYPRTVRNCRNFMMQRHNASSMEDVFLKLRKMASPVNIVFSYAFYYEKDSYAWHIDTWPESIDDYNKRLPPHHPIVAADTTPEMHQTVHAKYFTEGDPLQIAICYLQLYLGMNGTHYCDAKKYGAKPTWLVYTFENQNNVNHFGSWLAAPGTKDFAQRIVEERYEIVRLLYARNWIEFRADRIQLVDDYTAKTYKHACPKIQYDQFSG